MDISRIEYLIKEDIVDRLLDVGSYCNRKNEDFAAILAYPEVGHQVSALMGKIERPGSSFGLVLWQKEIAYFYLASALHEKKPKTLDELLEALGSKRKVENRVVDTDPFNMTATIKKVVDEKMAEASAANKRGRFEVVAVDDIQDAVKQIDALVDMSREEFGDKAEENIQEFFQVVLKATFTPEFKTDPQGTIIAAVKGLAEKHADKEEKAVSTEEVTAATQNN